MKKYFLITALILSFSLCTNAQDNAAASKVKHLTYKAFLKNIWDFEKNPNTFVFKGKTAAIVDFYANWCGPCRKVSPILEKLADEYDGKLTIYKVNVDEEKELAAAFNVRSIPTVLFIPTDGQPMMQVGAMNEAQFRDVISKHLVK